MENFLTKNEKDSGIFTIILTTSKRYMSKMIMNFLLHFIQNKGCYLGDLVNCTQYQTKKLNLLFVSIDTKICGFV